MKIRVVIGSRDVRVPDSVYCQVAPVYFDRDHGTDSGERAFADYEQWRAFLMDCKMADFSTLIDGHLAKGLLTHEDTYVYLPITGLIKESLLKGKVPINPEHIAMYEWFSHSVAIAMEKQEPTIYIKAWK